MDITAPASYKLEPHFVSVWQPSFFWAFFFDLREGSSQKNILHRTKSWLHIFFFSENHSNSYKLPTYIL